MAVEEDPEESGSSGAAHARRLAPTLVCAALPLDLNNAAAGTARGSTDAASHGFRAADGRALQDIYDLGRELGGGASSTVYFATDRSTGEPRALKILHRAPFDDEYMTAQYEAYKEATEAFHTEMKVLKRVDHPHIVRLYDAFESQSGFVVAMEFCSGGGLLDHLEKVDCFGEDSAAAAIRQICSALSHLHSQRIVHCDLKPENILVSGQTSTSEKHSCPLLKLADFGVAVFKGDRAVSVGASGYAAPEVMSGDQCDESGDMWSLGMVALVLLSGVNPASARRAIIFGQSPPLPEQTSAAAADFVSWCLNPVPAERCTAAQALAHDWLTGELPSVELRALSDSMRQLKQFGRLSRVQRAVMQIVAYAMPAEQIVELSEIFEMLDRDQDGELSPQELREGLRRIDPDCKHYDAVFNALDFDHTHAIHYNEFVAACLGRKRYLQREALWRAFCAIDTESKGNLSLKNLREAFCGSTACEHFSERRLQQAFDEMDHDHDGRVSFPEFHRMMAMGGVYATFSSRSLGGRHMSFTDLSRLASSNDLEGSPTTVRSAASAPAVLLADALASEGADSAAAEPTFVKDASMPQPEAPGPAPSSPVIAALLAGIDSVPRPRTAGLPSPSSPIITALLAEAEAAEAAVLSAEGSAAKRRRLHEPGGEELAPKE